MNAREARARSLVVSEEREATHKERLADAAEKRAVAYQKGADSAEIYLARVRDEIERVIEEGSSTVDCTLTPAKDADKDMLPFWDGVLESLEGTLRAEGYIVKTSRGMKEDAPSGAYIFGTMYATPPRKYIFATIRVSWY